LANFQACTGIEDIGKALEHLEESSWVLVDAVNRAIPASPEHQGGVNPLAPGTPPPTRSTTPPLLGPLSNASSDYTTPSFPQMVTPISESFSSYFNSEASVAGPSSQASGGLFGRACPPGASGLSRPSAGVSLACDFLPLGPSQRSRMLDLNITYRDRMIPLKVPDSESIRVVKELLQAEINVPPCQQELRGWATDTPFPQTDRRLLSELNLPKENFLSLMTPEIPPIAASSQPEEPPKEEIKITLKITDTTHEKDYTLTFPDQKLVGEVKKDVSTVTSIPVFRQVWTGWPPNTLDLLSLADCGIENNATLKVNQKPTDLNMPIVVDDDEEDVLQVSDDEYQDAPEHMDDEDIFVSQPSRSGIQPLLPDDFGDEALAGIKFGEEFCNRYGQPSPTFFPGSLDDALTESCNKNSEERRMLAVYLHHDNSVLTNVFCTQVLCADASIGLLSENFVTWGWDLTFSSNMRRLLDMINRHFGSVAASTLRTFDIEKFPLVILVAKIRGNLEILQIIHGNTTLAEFMTEVLSATENYNHQVGFEKREERERTERNDMKEQQERAFQEAQLLDQVKEKERQDAEMEAQLQEQMDEAKRRSEIEAKECEERRRREEQDAAAQILPQEPASSDTSPQANIRFRTPRETLTRRFLATDTLNTLLLYLSSVGYRPKEYKILSSWPRRDISVLEPNSSLAQLKLCPQETLTLEAHNLQDSDSE